MVTAGHSGTWNNAVIYFSDHQTIASQCPMQPLLNQLYAHAVIFVLKAV